MRRSLVRRLITDHREKVLWVIVLALLLGNAGGFIAGYSSHDAIQHALGGRKDSATTIRAHYHPVPPRALQQVGGGAGVVDLSYLFGPVLQQGNTNACGSFSLTALLYALYIESGQQPATYFSPWFHRYNAVGNTDGYTTMDQNIQAAYTGGEVYHWRQESPGAPTQAAYAHADARTVSYSVVSTGGTGTFATIRYELDLGHPVWILNAINDGMDYLASGNPYTDNGGAYHGAHFEVAVGVYGDYIKIRNSWGNAYGQGGYYYMSRYGIDATTEEAAIVTIGNRPVWPAPVLIPAPTATPRPTATAITRPTPTPRPLPTSRPTPTPTSGVGRYRMLRAGTLHADPAEWSRYVGMLGRGWVVTYEARQGQTAHWRQVCRLDRRCGWAISAAMAHAT